MEAETLRRSKTRISAGKGQQRRETVDEAESTWAWLHYIWRAPKPERIKQKTNEALVKYEGRLHGNASPFVFPPIANTM